MLGPQDNVSLIPAVGVSSRPIASFTSYDAAERVVDWISDQGFPVEHVSIVGTGLRYVEQVAGRVTTARAALLGAGQGAMLGLFWGLLFALFFTVTAGGFFGVLAYSVLLGAFFGALLRALAHFGMRGRRDFASVSQVRADRYEVLVDGVLAGEADRLLARMPSR